MSRRVTGLVRNPNGVGIAGARIWYRSRQVPTPDVALLTDGNGQFVLQLPSTEEYILEVAADGYAPHSVVLPASADPVDLIIQLTP